MAVFTYLDPVLLQSRVLTNPFAVVPEQHASLYGAAPVDDVAIFDHVGPVGAAKTLARQKKRHPVVDDFNSEGGGPCLVAFLSQPGGATAIC